MDVLFLQESHFTADISSKIAIEFTEWNMFNSYGTNNSKGCSIILNKTKTFDVIDVEVCNEGRFVFMNILVDNSTSTMVNASANNDKNNRNNFFQNINKLVADKA